jgi:hypothetical protein
LGAALAHRNLGSPELHFRLLEEGPFPGAVQVRDVPGRIEALSHLERDRERVDDCLEQLTPLLVGLVAIKRRPHRGGEVEHGTRHLELGLLKPGRGHTPAERPVENVEKTHRHTQIQFRRAARHLEEDGAVEDGVGEETRLDQIGLGHAQLGIRRLELPVVQQRHLDGLIGAQRAG